MRKSVSCMSAGTAFHGGNFAVRRTRLCILDKAFSAAGPRGQLCYKSDTASHLEQSLFGSWPAAWNARGPATEKALSEMQSRVRRTAKLPPCSRTEPSVVETIAQFCEVLWCDTMLDVEHQGTELDLYSAQHWQLVEPLPKRWHMRPRRCTTKKSGRSILHTLKTTECLIVRLVSIVVMTKQTSDVKTLFHQFRFYTLHISHTWTGVAKCTVVQLPNTLASAPILTNICLYRSNWQGKDVGVNGVYWCFQFPAVVCD